MTTQLETLKREREEALTRAFTLAKQIEIAEVQEAKQKENPWGLKEEPTGFSYGEPLYDFVSDEAQSAFSPALSTLIALRACGAVAHPTHAKESLWIISVDQKATTGRLKVVVDEVGPLQHAYAGLSPCYPSLEAAQAAIEKVGAARILAAMRTLAGVQSDE